MYFVWNAQASFNYNADEGTEKIHSVLQLGDLKQIFKSNPYLGLKLTLV